MTPDALAALAQPLPSLADIDRELARRRRRVKQNTGAPGTVTMKMLMAQHGRKVGDVFTCSPRIAEGYDLFGSAIRITAR